MLRIITLLNHKNHYLEKFYALNENEVKNFSIANFDNLETFYQTREKILEMIKYIDAEIDLISAVELESNSENRLQIKSAMAVKDEYVNRILAQDLEILSYIETAKSSIIRELQDLKKNKKIVGSYKSKSFNHRLDEEV